MSGKKVTFGTKPQAEKPLLDPDTWVSGGGQPTEGEPLAETEQETSPIITEPKMKRLTIDIPPDLHTRIKVKCAQDQIKIADIVRQLLEQKFPAS